MEIAFSLTSFLPLTMGLSAFFLQEKRVNENQNFKTLSRSTRYTLVEITLFIKQPAIYK
jgi:hypothetical protein